MEFKEDAWMEIVGIGHDMMPINPWFVCTPIPLFGFDRTGKGKCYIWDGIGILFDFNGAFI
jgi:hypothetical protein